MRKNTEDDEQPAFVDTIAIDAEQDNADYRIRGWQLDKLQRVKRQSSQQNDKILKEVYTWVLKKLTGITADEKLSIKRVMEILGSVYKSLSHRWDFILYTPNRTKL